MKRMKQMASPLGGFSSGASLGGKVSCYRRKQASTRKARLLTRSFTFKKEGYGSPPGQNINHQQLPPSWEWVISLASFASQATHFVCSPPSRVDRKLHTYHPAKKNDANSSQKERGVKCHGGLSAIQRPEVQGSRRGIKDLFCRTTPGARASAASARITEVERPLRFC